MTTALLDDSVDRATVAQILGDVEERGGLLAAPVAAPIEDVPMAAWQRSIKHGLDRDIAALLLVLLSPLLLVVGALVLLTSRGPMLFRQQRVGQNGRGFVILKFRSMRQPTAMVHFEPLPGVAPGGIEGDDRRTGVGRVIRALSIDELPQLVNVLRGEMSLVGPRPERPHFVERFSRELPGYADRHRVRPGITGWAQVHGLRGATSLRDRLELDREYIQFWSPWLDLKILALTGLTVVRMALTSSTDESGAPELALLGRRQTSPSRRDTFDDASAQLTPQGHGAGSSLDS